MQILPIVVAVLSLLVATATLFLSFLRAPKIVVHIGPGVELAYDKQGNADLVLPATFINVSNRTAIVLQAAVTLRRLDSSQPQFFMLWDDFMRYDQKKDQLEIAEIAHSLALPGKASVHQVIWFSWFGDQPTNVEYREGEYELALWWWEAPGRRPKKNARMLRVTSDEFQVLQQHRKARDTVLETIPLERTFEANMILSDKQIQTLLGP